MTNINEHTLKVQQLFMRHQGQLKAFVLTLFPDFARADDILQEVFLTVTEKADEFKLDTNFLAWSRSIARFKVLESQRRLPEQSLSPEVIYSLTAACPDSLGQKQKLETLSNCLKASSKN